MNELDLDAWITFTQKMGDAGGDPVYPIIFGDRDLGCGHPLLTRHGERIALVGGLDVAIPRAPASGIRCSITRAISTDARRGAHPARIRSASPSTMRATTRKRMGCRTANTCGCKKYWPARRSSTGC